MISELPVRVEYSPAKSIDSSARELKSSRIGGINGVRI